MARVDYLNDLAVGTNFRLIDHVPLVDVFKFFDLFLWSAASVSMNVLAVTSLWSSSIPKLGHERAVDDRYTTALRLR